MDPRNLFSQAISEINDMLRELWRYADSRPVALLAVGAVLVYLAVRRKNDLTMGMLGIASLAIFVYLMKLFLAG